VEEVEGGAVGIGAAVTYDAVMPLGLAKASVLVTCGWSPPVLDDLRLWPAMVWLSPSGVSSDPGEVLAAVLLI
jgi:hypothetical protein